MIMFHLVVTILLLVLFGTVAFLFRNQSEKVRYFCGGSIITVFIIGTIFAYGHYRCRHPEFKDPLEKPLFEKVPWLDGWGYTHFITFFLIGLCLRGNWKPLLVFVGVGVAWELFEHVVGKDRPGWMGGYGGCKMSTDREDGNWWYGKWADVGLNAIGILLGFSISLYLVNKKKGFLN